MDAERVIKILNLHGWVLDRVKGSHWHYKHATIKGLVTVPFHGKADLHPAIINNLAKTTGCNFNENISAIKKNMKKVEKAKADVFTDSARLLSRG